MQAKKWNSVLDQEIMKAFSKTFKIMGITTEELEDDFYDIAAGIPQLDAATQLKLGSDGLIIDGGWSNPSISFSTPNKYFLYKKRPMLVYIRDQYLRADQYQAGKFRKFHLCFCYQLQKKQKEGKYKDRYVITYRTTGDFLVNIYERDHDFCGKFYEIKRESGVFKKLKVCQDCLKALNWKNFRSYCGNDPDNLSIGTTYLEDNARNKIVNSFKIEEFLRKAKRDLFTGSEQLNTATGAFENTYDRGLTKAQKLDLKKSRNFICEECGRFFLPEQLEIHHRSSGRFNNSPDNLMLLCKHCHDTKHPDRIPL